MCEIATNSEICDENGATCGCRQEEIACPVTCPRWQLTARNWLKNLELRTGYVSGRGIEKENEKSLHLCRVSLFWEPAR